MKVYCESMKLSDTLLLILLAAIWGLSFIFMRATAEDFGPIVLITIRVGTATLILLGFLFVKKRRQEFIQYWKALFFIGLLNSALPFSFLAYASLTLNAGILSIINALTPVFAALVAHVWLKDKMTKVQLLGMLIGFSGITYLVWDKMNWDAVSWLPIVAAVMTTVSYGLAANTTKKYLKEVSPITATAGTLFFATLFMMVLALFFLPDFSVIPTLSWGYALALGALCTAFAYLLFFRLIQNIGPSKAVSVTFIIPIFSFLWAYLLLGEVVTMRMWVATAVILLGTGLVTGVIGAKKS
ncbi:MAG TPA: DMT family transporter [Leucothrix mucor]|uniref:DMT family transporter n=1 Tax=Leucothrix mucor TaxID=45248 RepID=A0A7V2T1R3_LEUMU|nr:DMT family transporter [Leucothrix mucor]